MSLLDRLLRREPDGPLTVEDPHDAVVRTEPWPAQLPDPSRPPQARGTWDQAALVNVDITERVKRQLGTVTPPWKK